MIALRQAGFEPVVACMGTALTEQQLRELGRLTKRLWLAFDGDAAGESATLRGMELAVAQGFDVKVVALPPGDRPGRRPGRVRGAGSPAPSRTSLYRVQVEARARGGPRGRRSAPSKAFLDARPDSPERQDAWRWANDHFGMTVQLRAPGRSARARPPRRRASLDAGDRLERDALAGVIAHPTLRPLLAELTPEHFHDPLHRALRAHLVDGDAARRRRDRARSPSSTPAPRPRGSTSATGKELLCGSASASCGASCSTRTPQRTKELQVRSVTIAGSKQRDAADPAPPTSLGNQRQRAARGSSPNCRDCRRTIPG